MTWMVVERFRRGAGPVYERFKAQGRMLPEGLVYVGSWVCLERGVCFQLMEGERGVLEAWMGRWADLVEFEVFAVVGSGEAAAESGAAGSGERGP